MSNSINLPVKQAGSFVRVATFAALPPTAAEGDCRWIDDVNILYVYRDGSWLPSGGGVSGPVSSTDNAVARFDGTTGALVQNSSVLIDDSGNITTSGTVDGRDVSTDGATLDAHVAATVAHGATGAVVGTTNTQTLTNKTLDTATNTITGLANANIAAAAAIDPTKIADGSVSATEFQYLDGVTSGIQSQLDNKQALDADLTALAGLTTTGIVVRTGAGTAGTRTIEAATSNITVSNGDGALGNPTLDLGNNISASKIANGSVSNTEYQYLDGLTDAIQTQLDNKQPLDADLTALAGLASTGLVARTGAGTVSARTLTAGSSKLSVLNGDGVSGNPTVDAVEAQFTLDNLGGTLAITKGGTGQTSATDAFDALSPTTTKGDLIGRTTTDNVRIPVGSNGQVLTADSTQTEGVKWSTINATGEKTYINNPSAVPDAAAALPSGWGLVGDLDAIATKTLSELPREFTTASGIKITATAGTQSTADYVYYDFSLDDVDLSKKLKIQWSQKVTGTYSAGELAVVITTQADRATALHTPVTSAIPAADGVFTTSFDSSTTAALSLVIRATTDMATNGGIVISDVVVGPGSLQNVPAIGDLGALTWTVSNNGSKTFTISTTQSRSDRYMLVKYGLIGNATASGSGASTAFVLNMPANHTIDSSALPVPGTIDSDANVLGTAQTKGILSTGNYDRAGVALPASTTSILFTLPTVSHAIWTSDLNSANAVSVVGELRIPIAEWAGSGTVNLAQNDVEYASNFDTNDAPDTTSFAYGPAGSTIVGALTADRKKRVRFQYPIQATDQITMEYSRDRITWVPFTYDTTEAPSGLMRIGDQVYGAGVEGLLVGSTTTDVDVVFGRYRNTTASGGYGGAGGSWATSQGYWRLKKSKAGAAVGFGLATATSSGLYKAGQAPGAVTGTTIAAGYVGEKLESANTSTVALTNNIFQDLASLPLTAGVWILTALAQIDLNSGDSGTTRFGINTTSGDNDTGFNYGQNALLQGNPAGATINIYMPPYYANISTPTTYYWKVKNQSTTGTVNRNGYRFTAIRIA